MLICKNCFYSGLCTAEYIEEEKCEYYAPPKLESIAEKEYRMDLLLRAETYNELVEEQNS